MLLPIQNAVSSEENDTKNTVCENHFFCKWAVREEGGVRLSWSMTVENTVPEQFSLVIT